MEGTNDYKRPSWDDYFLGVMEAIAKRGTCDRGRSGCVIAKDRQIISAGYVGSAAGDDHCDDAGHLFQERLNPDGSVSKHCVRTVHAEQNAICQAARRGIALDGATLYIKMTPCPICAKMVVNCGIKRVVCKQRYHDGKEAERLFAKCGVELVHLSEEEVAYSSKKGFHFSDAAEKGESVKTEATDKKFFVEKIHPAARFDSQDMEVILYAIEDAKIGPKSVGRVHSGIKIIIDELWEGVVRSIDFVGKDSEVMGGIISSGYDGEVLVPVANKSENTVEILSGEKIAKVLIRKAGVKERDGSKTVLNEEENQGAFSDLELSVIEELEDVKVESEPTPEEIAAALDKEENESKSRW